MGSALCICPTCTHAVAKWVIVGALSAILHAASSVFWEAYGGFLGGPLVGLSTRPTGLCSVGRWPRRTRHIQERYCKLMGTRNTRLCEEDKHI